MVGRQVLALEVKVRILASEHLVKRSRGKGLCFLSVF